VLIDRGDDIELRFDLSGKSISTKEKMYLQTQGLERVLRTGDSLYFSSGLKCQVMEVSDSNFIVRAKEDGIVHSRSQVTVPDKHHTLPVIKDQDVSDLERISSMIKIDYISIPFVNSKEDLKEIRSRLSFLENSVLIARIDDRKGIEEFFDVCEFSQGIIFNRRNLGYSFSPDKLFCLSRFFTE